MRATAGENLLRPVGMATWKAATSGAARRHAMAHATLIVHAVVSFWQRCCMYAQQAGDQACPTNFDAHHRGIKDEKFTSSLIPHAFWK